MNLFAFDAAQARDEAREFLARMSEARAKMQHAAQAQIGATSKELVYREGKVALYRYLAPAGAGYAAPRGSGDDSAMGSRRATRSRGRGRAPARSTRSPPPLLIVYALVNRPYMMDLQEDRSLIRGLLAQGLDVYLIDWGYPDRGDRFTGLADYILGYLERCVAHVCAASGRASIDLLGVCQGGTFSLCYTALRPRRVGRAIGLPSKAT